MNQVLLSLFFLVSAAQQKCNKSSIADIPSCVQAKITRIQQQPTWNPPATVTEYHYNGKRVFLFSSDCCDQYNEVVDAECNYICAPSGGLTGKGDRKCTDFTEKSELVKVVWKDERK